MELGGDECDNLHFMNFKIDSFKIRKNSWISENFKIRIIRILNLCDTSSRWVGTLRKFRPVSRYIMESVKDRPMVIIDH